MIQKLKRWVCSAIGHKWVRYKNLDYSFHTHHYLTGYCKRCGARRKARLLFACLLLFLPLTLHADAPPIQVYDKEYVVYARGDFCKYSPGISECELYTKGVHLFYDIDGELVHKSKAHLARRELKAFDFGSDFDTCNTVSDGTTTTCSQNLFFKVEQTNDPEINKQWHLQAVRAQDAWRVKRTPEDCTIAVLDTGVDCSHPDLRERCTLGYNAITDKHNWTGADVNGHGTHVAGTIAAQWDNRYGGVGVSECKIMPVKVLGDSGAGSLYSVMKGVDYVRASGHAGIINMSLGSGGFSSSFNAAVQDAIGAGIKVIAAAGNSGTNNDRIPHYPSNFNGVVSVGATDMRGNRASFSNFGNSVDITAPGVGIYATLPGNRHGKLSGTSMATPIVAGAYGLAGRGELKGKLDMYQLVNGGGSTPEPVPVPVPIPDPECKQKKLKRCFTKRCLRLKRYGRIRLWRACRKYCRRSHCETEG